MYLGEGRFGAQLKYADRRGALCAVIQGSSEKDEGKVQIKDLKVGAELAAIAKNDREAYLQQAGRGAVPAPEDELVDAARKALARHVPYERKPGDGRRGTCALPLPRPRRERPSLPRLKPPRLCSPAAVLAHAPIAATALSHARAPPPRLGFARVCPPRKGEGSAR